MCGTRHVFTFALGLCKRVKVSLYNKMIALFCWSKNVLLCFVLEFFPISSFYKTVAVWRCHCLCLAPHFLFFQQSLTP